MPGEREEQPVTWFNSGQNAVKGRPKPPSSGTVPRFARSMVTLTLSISFMEGDRDSWRQRCDQAHAQEIEAHSHSHSSCSSSAPVAQAMGFVAILSREEQVLAENWSALGARNHLTSARDQIVRILQSLTDISAAELGRRVGVSRERVRQILKDLGYPTARGKGRPHGSTVLTAVGTAGGGRLGKPAAVQLVAEDLLGKGLAIFAPVRANKECDLIAIEGNGAVSLICVSLTRRPGLRRLQPRRARPGALGGVKGFVVRRAYVLRGTAVLYDPPFSEPYRARRIRAN